MDAVPADVQMLAGKGERPSDRVSLTQMEVKNAQDEDEPWGRQAV